MISVTLAGATGWVGVPLADAIDAAEDMTLVAAVARKAAGERRGEVTIAGSIEDALAVPSDVVVDYTSAAAAKHSVLAAIRAGRHVVVGSSGLTDADYAEVARAAEAAGVGVVAVGNFAITAALMQRFAVEAAKYLPGWEIIDTAYAGKMDAPSGTARELAWKLKEAHGKDSPIHSVRIDGYTIGLEIRFGRQDERLTISYDGGAGAGPYVAGTLLAIRRVREFRGLVRGMDRLL